MAGPIYRLYNTAAGSIVAGRFAGGRFTGSLLLASALAAGSMQSNASSFSGNLALTPIAAASAFTTLNPNTALMGDSLTTHLLGYNWSPFWWINGIAAKGALKLIANAGISGDTIGQMLSRVNNNYTAATPGLAGLGSLGTIFFRGGTNDARGVANISGLSATYTSLLTAIKAYCQHVIILSVPPVGPSEANYANINAATLTYNTWLAAFAAANPNDFTFVNDSANLRNGDGSQKSGYFQSDGIHNDGRATYIEGVDGAAALASRFATYASPIITDPAYVYPAKPQWNDNHLMVGTAGSLGTGFTGQVVTGYGVGGYGAGYTGTCSIVAADVGDPNQTPWQRVAPTQVPYSGAGEEIVISKTFTGRTITTTDPAYMDIIVEVRFNAFDSTYFRWSRIQLLGSTSNQPLFPDLDLKLGGEVITKPSVVKRIAMGRILASSESGMYLRWAWSIRSAFAGSMGSFDFRCLTAEG